MEEKTVTELFDTMENRLGVEEYNYHHFSGKYALMDIRATMAERGIGPGCPAPDFELENTEGSLVRLSNLRGKPVVLRFSSIT
ncbi:MAG: redoxin domain-containing protein [Desulfomonilia bacterium]|jgi:hypothetical protein|nr:redoxin domain-containing protein [Deltaproteobacteria bacterium]MDX9760890.1 redoxin domain-containing protein [Desulfomonilia bacterium]HPW69065.1 redoxin domain-containing protein [Deltaproteobacteria bacterium]